MRGEAIEMSEAMGIQYVKRLVEAHNVDHLPEAEQAMVERLRVVGIMVQRVNEELNAARDAVRTLSIRMENLSGQTEGIGKVLVAIEEKRQFEQMRERATEGSIRLTDTSPPNPPSGVKKFTMEAVRRPPEQPTPPAEPPLEFIKEGQSKRSG